MLIALDRKQEQILSRLLAAKAQELADKVEVETTPANLEELAAVENLILQIATK